MEFRIIYGKSGSGKTTEIFKEIKEKIKDKNKIYIVVPEQFSFSAENHLLETIDGNSSINAEDGNHFADVGFRYGIAGICR